MSKPIGAYLADVSARAAAAPTINPDAKAVTAKLFMLMHGMYGNLFLSKFATGELNDDGKDRGILSARIVWQSDLERFDSATVEEAARRCKGAHTEFPPSLPQFLALCEAARPRKVYAGPPHSNAIGMSNECRSAHSRRVREAAIARARKRIAEEGGTVPEQGALPMLQQLIARAVALAGGDEAATLRNMEAA